MKRIPIYKKVVLALTSTTFFVSCGGRQTDAEATNLDSLVTMQSTSLTVIDSKNGTTDYRFVTPLLERYELAQEPFMEFRRGIDVISYDAETGAVESTLVADYAKYLERQQLWEARGNVVATGSNGQKLETEQLFWDEKEDRIYSVVRSTMTDGEDVTIGEGFETNSAFDHYRIRGPRGQVTVDTEPNRDSTVLETPVDSTAFAADTLVVP